MRVLRVAPTTESKDHSVLVTVEHRKFFVTWEQSYVGTPTSFEGVYRWRRWGHDTILPMGAMTRFLDNRVKEYFKIVRPQ